MKQIFEHLKSAPTDKRLDKEDTIHPYNGILLSHKEKWGAAIYSKMKFWGNYV